MALTSLEAYFAHIAQTCSELVKAHTTSYILLHGQTLDRVLGYALLTCAHSLQTPVCAQICLYSIQEIPCRLDVCGLENCHSAYMLTHSVCLQKFHTWLAFVCTARLCSLELTAIPDQHNFCVSHIVVR